MKSYTETTALVEKIDEMKMRREEQANWSAEDEQMLAFLVELHILRITLIHSINENNKIVELITNLQDDMQDEKGLLVY